MYDTNNVGILRARADTTFIAFWQHAT